MTAPKLPSSGGSYVRNSKGALKRVSEPPAPEPQKTGEGSSETTKKEG